MKISNEYTLIDKLKLVLYLIRTKLICRKSRLIRFPIDIRGKSYIDFGTRLTTGKYCRLEAFSSNKKKKICFGDNVQINDFVHISAIEKVSIGNHVLMASHIYISDNTHGIYNNEMEETSPLVPPAQRPYYVAEVSIGDNVWIGEGVIILPGVSIGEGCIVAANSVVNQSVQSYCMVAGSPASVKKKFNFQTKKWEKQYKL